MKWYLKKVPYKESLLTCNVWFLVSETNLEEGDSRPDLMLPHLFKDNEANYKYEDEKPTVAVARAMAARKQNLFSTRLIRLI